MSGPDSQPEVPNPYLAAIKDAKAGSEPAARTLRQALDKAVRAMDAGAWVGGASDQFYTALTGHRTTIRTSSSHGMDHFDEAIRGMPTKVPPDSWYCHWRRFSYGPGGY